MSHQSPIEKFVDDLDQTELTDLVGIVASQDPTEQVDGRARWNAEQRSVIQQATTAYEEAGLSD